MDLYLDENNDAVIDSKIMDLENNIVIEKFVKLKDLEFDSESLRFDKMCYTLHSNHRKITTIIHYLFLAIKERMPFIFGFWAVFASLLFVIPAIGIRIISLFL